MTWEDAPSHICRGGDVRGLAFCCPPVKPCPVLHALQEVNLTPQEFVDIKIQFGKETLTFEIDSVRAHKGCLLVTFKGYHNINDVEKYKGLDLYNN